LPEDVLRYRVEIDPLQAEAALASIRSGVGSALSGASYGAGLVSGGFNSLRSDLSYTAAAITSPLHGQPVDHGIVMDRRLRSLQLGTAEAAMAVGSLSPWAAAAYGVGAATIGTAATNAGIAAGVGTTAGAISGIGSMAASSITGTASFLGSGIAAAAASPLAVPVAAGVAAGALIGGGAYFTMQTAERSINDMQARFDIQDRLTGIGIGLGRSKDIASKIVSAGSEIGTFTGSQTAAIFDEFAGSGMLDRFAADPKKIEQKMREGISAARQIMQALNVGSRAAVEMVNEMSAVGVGPSDAVSGIASMRVGSRLLGQAGMAQASQMGANLATSVGMRGVAGIGVGISAGIAAQTVGAGMESATYRMLGGQQGIQSAIARSQMGFLETDIGKTVGIGLLNDPHAMGAFMGGQMGLSGAMMSSAGAFARGGVKSLFAMDDAKARMSSSEIQGIQAMTALNIMGDLGLGADEENLAMVMAQMDPSIDFNTTQGRQMGLAMAKTIMDPASKMRQFASATREASDRMSGSTGVMASIGNFGRAAFDEMTTSAAGLGESKLNRFTLGLSRPILSAAESANKLLHSRTKRTMLGVGGFVGEHISEGLGNLIKGTAGRISVSGTLGRDVGSMKQLLDTIGLKSGSDVISLLREKTGFKMTDEQIKEENKMAAISSAGARVDKGSVDKAFRVLVSDDKLMRDIEDLPYAEKVRRVASAAGLGGDDVNMASVSRAMSQRGIEFKGGEFSLAMSEESDKLKVASAAILGWGGFYKDLGEDWFTPTQTTLGEHLDEIIGGKTGVEGKVSAAQSIMEYAKAIRDPDGKISLSDAAANLRSTLGSKSQAETIIKELGADRKLAAKLEGAMGARLKTNVAQQTTTMLAAAPGLFSTLMGSGSEATAKLLASIGDETMDVMQDPSQANVFGSRNEERSVEALRTFQAEAQSQIILMQSLTSRLEAISNKMPGGN
jgi:hypothetical protein